MQSSHKSRSEHRRFALNAGQITNAVYLQKLSLQLSCPRQYFVKDQWLSRITGSWNLRFIYSESVRYNSDVNESTEMRCLDDMYNGVVGDTENCVSSIDIKCGKEFLSPFQFNITLCTYLCEKLNLFVDI